MKMHENKAVTQLIEAPQDKTGPVLTGYVMEFAKLPSSVPVGSSS